MTNTYGQRNYKNIFNKSSTRYIETEINVVNKNYNVRDAQLPYKIQYYFSNGSLFGEMTCMAESHKEWTNFYWTHGYGWKEAGNWTTGSYTAKVWFDNVYIGEFYFQIVN